MLSCSLINNDPQGTILQKQLIFSPFSNCLAMKSGAKILEYKSRTSTRLPRLTPPNRNRSLALVPFQTLYGRDK